MSTTEVYDWIVIGGGVSGCYLGHQLSSQGAQVAILEKSRGLGGRLCSRRTPHGVFLHGAQFFTIRTEAFRRALSPLFGDVIREWKGQFGYVDAHGFLHKATEIPRYQLYPETSSFCDLWSKKSDVFLQHCVQSIHHDSVWTIRTTSGQVFMAHSIAISIPTPQAFEILDPEYHILLPSEATWKRTTAVMIRFKQDTAIFFSALCAAFVTPTSLDFLASQESRLEKSHRHNWTFLLNDSWAERHWKCDPKLAVNEVFQALSELQAPVTSDVEYSTVQFWKYARPNAVVSAPQWFPEHKLALLGEVFQDGRVEGAFLSALHAWEQINQDGM